MHTQSEFKPPDLANWSKSENIGRDILIQNEQGTSTENFSGHVAVDWSRRLRSGYVWGHGKFSDSKEPLFGTRRTFRRSGTAATCHAKLDEFLQVMYGHILVWVWVVRCGRPTIDLHNARTCRSKLAARPPGCNRTAFDRHYLATLQVSVRHNYI